MIFIRLLKNVLSGKSSWLPLINYQTFFFWFIYLHRFRTFSTLHIWSFSPVCLFYIYGNFRYLFIVLIYVFFMMSFWYQGLNVVLSAEVVYASIKKVKDRFSIDLDFKINLINSIDLRILVSIEFQFQATARDRVQLMKKKINTQSKSFFSCIIYSFLMIWCRFPIPHSKWVHIISEG